MTIPTDELVQAAQAAQKRAYAPYSNYFVGAAVLCEDGEIVSGCNVENASYPATICAERVALTAAVALGKRSFRAMALVTADGGTPCGICRQVMSELAPDLMLYICNRDGVQRTTTVADLLPDSFESASLSAS